jgi:hypothetical protein
MVFDYAVLRRIFGPKGDEVSNDCRNPHNEEFHNLYSSPRIIRMENSMRTRSARHVVRMREKELKYDISEKTRREIDYEQDIDLRLENNIKIDIYRNG